MNGCIFDVEAHAASMRVSLLEAEAAKQQLQKYQFLLLLLLLRIAVVQQVSMIISIVIRLIQKRLLYECMLNHILQIRISLLMYLSWIPPSQPHHNNSHQQQQQQQQELDEWKSIWQHLNDWMERDATIKEIIKERIIWICVLFIFSLLSPFLLIEEPPILISLLIFVGMIAHTVHTCMKYGDPNISGSRTTVSRFIQQELFTKAYLVKLILLLGLQWNKPSK